MSLCGPPQADGAALSPYLRRRKLVRDTAGLSEAPWAYLCRQKDTRATVTLSEPPEAYLKRRKLISLIPMDWTI
jgi:hypothetical protein